MTDTPAAAAAELWGRPAAPPRLVSHRENRVYEVRYADGRHAALRLHRPGYQDAEGIRSELALARALAETGFACPQPLPLPDGELCAVVDGVVVSLVTWIDAPALADGAGRMVEIGALAARLHDAADRVGRPAGVVRPSWDADGLAGGQPLWGRFWEAPALTASEAAELAAFSTAAHATLTALPDPDTGLIHADMLRENILDGADGLVLIDFDDSGFGFRWYELGSALMQGVGEPDLAARARDLLAGYAALRPLPGDAPRLLTLFTTLRCCASLAWLVPRRAADDRWHRIYADRALGMVRLWTGGGSVC